MVSQYMISFLLRTILDASLTGLGGCFKDFVYAITLPLLFGQYSIVHLEMLNVMVVLKVWGQVWINTKIHILCDNFAVVQVLNSVRSRDTILAS